MEDPGFGVVLTESGTRGLDVVQAIRSVTGLSAWRSKQLMGSAPTKVVGVTSFKRAAEAARRLNAAGARASLACDWCERVISLEDCPVDPAPCASRYWPATSCGASHPRP